MSDADRLAAKREANRIRQARYYEANKAKVAEQRKARRKAINKELADCRGTTPPAAPAAPAPQAPPAPKKLGRGTESVGGRITKVNGREWKPIAVPPIVIPPVEEPVPARISPEERQRRIEAARKSARGVKKGKGKAKAPAKLTQEQALQIIETSDAFESDGSRKTYVGHLRTVQDLLGCEDLRTCFQDATQVIKQLEEARQKRDPSKTYSLNSKKAYVQAILKLSDVLGIELTPETKQQYVDAFDVLKLDSKKQTEQRVEEGKQEQGQPKTFDEYLPRVRDTFGTDSKEYLVASLYSIHGFRDNLKGLRTVREIDDKGDNQLIVPSSRDKPYRIYLARYKTGNKYGPKTIEVPPEIGKLIRAYTTQNKLKLGQPLLGSASLSGFVSGFNKQMGLPFTINSLRELHVAPVIDSLDSKGRVELAKKMGHAPATSEQYRKKKK